MINKKTNNGQIFNVGCGRAYKVKKIITFINSYIKRKTNFGEIKLRNEENLITFPKINKAKKLLNWKPKTSFKNGIIKTINYYKKNMESSNFSWRTRTRLAEYTQTIPKPMVKIGKFPIVIHIMGHYLKYGLKDFILATGYKNQVLKNILKILKVLENRLKQKFLKISVSITLVNTGLNTLTGGRLKRIKNFITDESFMFTYGDGVSDVNLKILLSFHLRNKKMITVTAVRPPARFGEITIENNKVTSFIEKPQVTNGWINGGFLSQIKVFLS